MPRSWRIVKAKHVATAFDGEGARRTGGRWSSPGLRAVYTAESRALAVLEVLVHLNVPALLTHYVIFAADFPAAAVATLDAASLPANWRTFPAPTELQRLGDKWLTQRRAVVLRVPSAVVEGEFNYLLNPEHASFPASVTVSSPVPLAFDPRLLKATSPP